MPEWLDAIDVTHECAVRLNKDGSCSVSASPGVDALKETEREIKRSETRLWRLRRAHMALGGSDVFAGLSVRVRNALHRAGVSDVGGLKHALMTEEFQMWKNIGEASRCEAEAWLSARPQPQGEGG